MFAIVLIVVSACRFTSSRRRWCVLWHSLTLPVGQTFGLSNWPLHWPGPKSLEHFMLCNHRMLPVPCSVSPKNCNSARDGFAGCGNTTHSPHTHTRSDFKAWNAPINVIPVAASSHTQISCILYLNMLEKKWKEDVYLLITCKAHDSSLDASLPHCVYTHKHIHRCTCTPRDYDIIFSYIFFVLCLVWITKYKLRKCNWNIP